MFPSHTAPAEEIWVALDLETTGLDDAKDAIIEVGAVKFRGSDTLDTFHSLANPHRRIPAHIAALTGIRQPELNTAPDFEHIAADLTDFIGESPLVIQTAQFDLGFLRRNGVSLSNPVVDTYDLAYVLRPGMQGYSLRAMAQELDIQYTARHRALDDATTAKNIFLALLEDAYDLDAFTVTQMQRLARSSSWSLGYLLDALAANPQYLRGDAGDADASGIDIRRIASRLHNRGALRESDTITPIDTAQVAALLGEGGALSDTLDGYEMRDEQIQMAQAVANAINNGERIIAEAGTGVGKSLAYLLPAALYALANGKRIVISTNTLNLQDQILHKDMPILVQALNDTGSDLRFTDLKGRDNYLCMRRWHLMRNKSDSTPNEARLLAKTLAWMHHTATGDRAEMNLGRRTAASPWERLSAQGARGCMGSEPLCFLRSARERAAASHLVIINHALLMSDVAADGALIGDYDVLIIDEAHHLEDAATDTLGFEMHQSTFDDHIELLSGESGLPNQAVASFRTASVEASRRDAVNDVQGEISNLLPRLRQSAIALFAVLSRILQNSSRPNANPRYGDSLRITAAVRHHPDWSEAEIAWENADLTLGELHRLLGRLNQAFSGLEDAGLLNYEALQMEVMTAADATTELRQKLNRFVVNPDDAGIYWLYSRADHLSLHMAPLHVSDLLEEKLFSQKRSVVMTSATLSANDSFEHIIERTGFTNATELMLGSPFDYPNAAILCVPRDMPAQNSWMYRDALEQAIIDAATAADGRTLALFTSYASLNRTANAITDRLQARGISVLQQRSGEPAAQLVQRFINDPKAVLLGTMSLWEGIDLAGDLLKVLMVEKLPFNVPTEPVFEARSELYDNSFMQYSVPQAILKLRQGFGRLIRTKRDRGAAVILDRRIVTSRYGAAFLRSLPPAHRVDCSLHELGDHISSHLHGNPTSRQHTAPPPKRRLPQSDGRRSRQQQGRRRNERPAMRQGERRYVRRMPDSHSATDKDLDDLPF